MIFWIRTVKSLTVLLFRQLTLILMLLLFFQHTNLILAFTTSQNILFDFMNVWLPCQEKLQSFVGTSFHPLSLGEDNWKTHTKMMALNILKSKFWTFAICLTSILEVTPLGEMFILSMTSELVSMDFLGSFSNVYHVLTFFLPLFQTNGAVPN